jgi:hypothetical protein
MANRILRADIIEVPLPNDLSTQACMPMVIMQPTADASDYMLKPNFATNGRPGVVDHAVIADEASTVIWATITDLPAVFPPTIHGKAHLPFGGDPIPFANTQLGGLMPAGNGQPLSYLGGDINWHALPGLVLFVSEADVTVESTFVSGATLASGVVPNAQLGVYIINMTYLFNCNQSYPPAGTVHFDVYDSNVGGWVAVTSTTDISVMNTVTYLLRPTILSAAMTRIFSAGPNALQWRLVLDVSNAVTCYFRCGIAFALTGISHTIP